MSTTKRHPSRLQARIGATRDGRLTAMDFTGEFNTGAYASWGSTVANRVPVHAGGPYVYDAYRARTVAIHTNAPPAGAFRGFGVPQSTIAQECLFDELADAVGMDRARVPVPQRAHGGCADGHRSGVRLRHRIPRLPGCASSALAASPGGGGGERTPTAARSAAASASPACGTAAGTRRCRTRRRSRSGSGATGASRCYQGAVDMGQGANTVMTQICADAIGVEMASIVTLGRRYGHHAGRGEELRVAADVHLRERHLPGGDGAPREAPRARRRLGRRAHRVGRVRAWSCTTGTTITTVDSARWMRTWTDCVAVAGATYDPPTTAAGRGRAGRAVRAVRVRGAHGRVGGRPRAGRPCTCAGSRPRTTWDAP